MRVRLPASILTNGIKAGYAGIDTGLGKAGIKDQAIKDNMSPQEIDKINKANKNNSSAANYNLVGAYASIGHSSNKSHLTTESTRDTGSVVSAGRKVSINAKNDINATTATINGNDVIFNAGRDINLNAGHDTDKAKRKTSSKSFGVGVTADIGMGGGSAMINANMALSGSNMHSSSTTAIDTIVNGQHSVIINNKNGSLNLNGAHITNKIPTEEGSILDGKTSSGSIVINTGSMNITTPQNRNRYDSDSKSLGMQAGIPLAGFGLAGDSSPDIPESQDTITGGVKDIHNNYLSTEKHVSGIEAGSGGLDINVGGTTTINGGAITSTADASKNVINTDRLVGNSLDNHSIWSGLNVNGTETLKSQYTVAGIATDEKENNLLPGNVLNKVVGPGFTGNITTHNEHSKTEAAIGDNITINAGSITGTISRDPDAANGYLADRFDANKIDSNFKKQNEITQTINTISDAIINTVYNDKKANRDNHAQSGNALKPNGGKGTNVTATHLVKSVTGT